MTPSGAARNRILRLGAFAATVGLGAAWLMNRQSESIHSAPPSSAYDSATPLSSPTEGATVPEPPPAPRRKSHGVPWPLGIFVSLWFWLALGALLLADIGFALLPIDQTAIDTYHPMPLLTIWADQPNVNLVAVLDDSSVGEGALQSMSVLKLYADTNTALTVRVTSSIPNSIQEAKEPWVSDVQIHVAAQQHEYSAVETEFRAGRIDYLPNAIPAGYVFIRADPHVFLRAGAHLVFTPPDLTLGVDVKSSGLSATAWYPPQGEVVVIAPTTVEYYRTDIVGPAFAAPGVWRDPQVLFPIWSGTDPVTDSLEQRNLFIAGLVFGVAGSALVASVQELASRIREWVKMRRDKTAPSDELEPSANKDTGTP